MFSQKRKAFIFSNVFMSNFTVNSQLDWFGIKISERTV